MLSLLLSFSCSTNFTDILSGNWNITGIDLNQNTDELVVPRPYRINFQPSAQVGHLTGDLHGEDSDGAPVLLAIVSVAPNSDSNDSFAFDIASPETPDDVQPFATVTFGNGIEGVFTAAGSAKEVGTFSVVLLSPSELELTVFNNETKVATVYRGLKDIVRPQRSMMAMLLPMLPTLLMMLFSGRRTPGPAQPAGAGQAKPKTD
jgi:hypothetical protein